MFLVINIMKIHMCASVLRTFVLQYVSHHNCSWTRATRTKYAPCKTKLATSYDIGHECAPNLRADVANIYMYIYVYINSSINRSPMCLRTYLCLCIWTRKISKNEIIYRTMEEEDP